MAKEKKWKKSQQSDKKAPSDRICCCDLKTAGITVAFVEFLLCLVAIFALIWNLAFLGVSYLFWFIVGIISILIISIAIILLLYAIKKESDRLLMSALYPDRLLIPHLSAQIFLIGWLLIVVLVVFILLIFSAYNGIRRLVGIGDHYVNDESTRWTGIMIIVVHLAIAILELFFLYIVWKLYKSFHQKAKLTGGTTTTLLGKQKGGPVHVHPPANGDWYKPGQNQYLYGGSPDMMRHWSNLLLQSVDQQSKYAFS